MLFRFRVSGFGFMIFDFRFRVSGLGFGDLWFMVWGLEI